MTPSANGFDQHIGLSTRESRGYPNFSRRNKHFFDGGRFSPVCTCTYIGSRGAGHRRRPRAPGCQCKGGRGFSKRAEDFASGRHFCGVSSADFGAGIGLYVSETDPIGTFFGARTPIENFRLASPKAQLRWAALGHVPKGLRILRCRPHSF